MTILIVDDETDLRETLKEWFEAEGFDVELAADGVEAMSMLRRLPRIAAVVLDVIMPRMDGVQVLAAMQQDPKLAKVPVVLTTSDPSKAPQGVLTMRKPVNLDLLTKTVRMLSAAQIGKRSFTQ